jgi:hypothetical protein
MITIEQKREACIKYETDWLHHGADWRDMEDVMRNGFIGWVNMPDEASRKVL